MGILVCFEFGDIKIVILVEIGGNKVICGGNELVSGGVELWCVSEIVMKL